jgi:hypothetical protein
VRERVLQTTAPDDLASALKVEAARLRVTLLDIYAEAFENFFRHRMALRKAGKTVPYLVAPKSARPLNVRVPLLIAMKAQALADQDDMTVRAFTYTALVDYAMKRALIDSIGPLQSGILDSEVRERSGPSPSLSAEDPVFDTGVREVEKTRGRLPSPRPSTAPYVNRADRGKYKAK